MDCKRTSRIGPYYGSGLHGAILHIYAAGGEWDLSENIQKQRKERCFRKQPDCTWIEVNNEVLHTFVVND